MRMVALMLAVATALVFSVPAWAQYEKPQQCPEGQTFDKAQQKCAPSETQPAS